MVYFPIKGSDAKSQNKRNYNGQSEQKKKLHWGKEIPKQTSKLPGGGGLGLGGGAEIGEYSLAGKEFSFACDWFREQCKFFS